MKLPAVLLLVLGAAAATADKIMFTETCKDCTVNKAINELDCFCRMNHERIYYRRALLDLMKCVGVNDQGDLVGKKDGNATCTDFRLEKDMLVAMCDNPNNKGKKKESKVKADFIANQVGNLECYGLRGQQTTLSTTTTFKWPPASVSIWDDEGTIFWRKRVAARTTTDSLESETMTEPPAAGATD